MKTIVDCMEEIKKRRKKPKKNGDKNMKKI